MRESGLFVPPTKNNLLPGSKVLAQRRTDLMNIVRRFGIVVRGSILDHTLIFDATDRLPRTHDDIFERTDLQRNLPSSAFAGLSKTPSGIDKAGVVRTVLARPLIHRHHFAGKISGNAQCL